MQRPGTESGRSYSFTEGSILINATAAWPLVEGLEPAHIGIKLDPGNSLAQEGYEYFPYQIDLLGEYVAALGAKDGCSLRNQPFDDEAKGWKRVFAPATEGQTNYPLIFRELCRAGFDGPVILMPFYHENDEAARTSVLKKELLYLKTNAAAAHGAAHRR